MRKAFIVSSIVVSLLALAACATSSTTEQPLSDDDQIATIVAGTLTAVPSLTPTIYPTTTLTPEFLASTNANMQTYVDPEFGFKLQYDLSWQLDVKSGSGMIYYDGNGRTVWLEKNGYIFQLAVIGGPGDVNNCAGFFQEDPTNDFWVFMLDDVEIWRIKAEQGEVNGYYDDTVSFIDILSPLEVHDDPNNEYWGSYTCEPQISNHGVRIHYMLPVSLASIETGNFNQEILTEMDNILVSLTWR